MDKLTFIKDKIRYFIIKSSYISEDMVKYDTLIFMQGILDSMGFINLINFLEDSFSLKVNDNDLVETNFESVNAIADFVARKIHVEKLQDQYQ
jgi:acyl carrier protein